MFEPKFSSKVVIEKQPWNDTSKIWFVGRWADGRHFNYTVNKGGYLLATEMKEGTEMPDPLMIIPRDMLQQIVDAFVETVPPTKKEVVEAQLEATKYHLEDMRKLVFVRRQDTNG